MVKTASKPVAIKAVAPKPVVTSAITKGLSVTRTGATATALPPKAASVLPPSLRPGTVKTPAPGSSVLSPKSGGVTTQAQTAAKQRALQELQTSLYPQSPTVNKLAAPMNASVNTGAETPATEPAGGTSPLVQSLVDMFGPALAAKIAAPPITSAPTSDMPPSEQVKAIATAEGLIPGGFSAPAEFNADAMKQSVAGVPMWMLLAGAGAMIFMMMQSGKKR